MLRTRLCLALLATTLLARPALAQISGTPLEFSVHGGWFAPDARLQTDSAPEFGGTLGWRAQRWLVLEGQGFLFSSEDNGPLAQSVTFKSYGVDMRMNMRSADGRVVPYLLVGMGVGSSEQAGVSSLTKACCSQLSMHWDFARMKLPTARLVPS